MEKLPKSSTATSSTDLLGEFQPDVVLLGAGLAGLSLARHLLLETDRRVLLIERRKEVPPPRQKVGESLVQVGGYYLSKVLDLEEHLLCEHLMKYNLRFYWPTPGRSNAGFEDYGKAYIRPFSNIASYQLDRNKLEAELLRLNNLSPRFRILTGARLEELDLGEALDSDKYQAIDPPEQEGPPRQPPIHTLHLRVADEELRLSTPWLVDTSGRARALARQLDWRRANSIRHGAFFLWVDGLVDIEKLTGRSPREVRIDPERQQTGHLPTWLATNHFMGEGFWFWVIPLQGKTSLGLVFDHELIPHEKVFSKAKLVDWVCETFPLFERDLRERKILDYGGLPDFSHDCLQTLSSRRFAFAGEAGRFTDPLYSPGSDLIALYNTLIVDAIQTEDPKELAAKCRLHEQLMRAAYSAYVPSYADAYDALGDQETFVLKYVWELTIYFAFYVFPFINDLLLDRRFAIAFLRQFARLGPWNRSVQQVLSGYFRWKDQRSESARRSSAEPETAVEPICFDFMEFEPLARAEKTFYEVGVSVETGRKILAEQLENIRELGHFVLAHVAATVADAPQMVTSKPFVEALNLDEIEFDPALWRQRAAEYRATEGTWTWSFDSTVLDRFRAHHPANPERCGEDSRVDQQEVVIADVVS
ncbi:MAG: hypothetical protein AAGD01_03530 [Acidobacteriota bacterium]